MHFLGCLILTGELTGFNYLWSSFRSSKGKCIFLSTLGRRSSVDEANFSSCYSFLNLKGLLFQWTRKHIFRWWFHIFQMIVFHVIIITAVFIGDFQSGFFGLLKISCNTYPCCKYNCFYCTHQERGSDRLNVTQQVSWRVEQEPVPPDSKSGRFFVTEHRHVHLEHPHKYSNPMGIH